jgi:hypothetical protein
VAKAVGGRPGLGGPGELRPGATAGRPRDKCGQLTSCHSMRPSYDNSKRTCKLNQNKYSFFTPTSSSFFLQKIRILYPQSSPPHILVCSILPPSITQRIKSSTTSRRLYRLHHMSHLEKLLEYPS